MVGTSLLSPTNYLSSRTRCAGRVPSITISPQRSIVTAGRYLLVVGERFALSGQRVGPVLSHGPLLRWHGFHQGAIYPRLRAHALRIPIMREFKISKVYPAESGTRSRCESIAAVASAFCPLGASPVSCVRVLFELSAAHTSAPSTVSISSVALRNTSALALQNKRALDR